MIAETPMGRIREALKTVVACGACTECAALAKDALTAADSVEALVQRLADGAGQMSQTHTDVLAALSEIGVKPI